jgi:hypothetical protein
LAKSLNLASKALGNCQRLSGSAEYVAIKILTLFLGSAALLPSSSHAQEIEARTYSNAPIGINFISTGIAQARSGNYTLTSEVLGLTHIFDAGGQSGNSP